ncbi:MAG: methyltransferase domain-containing protein [Steroidobacteraceae bacterium]
MPHVDSWESFFDPTAILDVLGCSDVAGDAVEFGCGYGTFTIPAAQRVSGTLYASDIDPAMVVSTGARTSKNGIRNIVVEERDFLTSGSGRPDASVSFVMLFNILHVEESLSLLIETHRILSEGGTVAVIHWRQDIQTPRGPPLSIRPSPEQCGAWGKRAGLRTLSVIGELPNSPWHWGMLLAR